MDSQEVSIMGEELNKKEIKSYHIFMFPLKWNYKKSSKCDFEKVSFDEKVEVEKFISKLGESNWEQVYQDIRKHAPHLDYNEQKYFYDDVKREMYSKEK